MWLIHTALPLALRTITPCYQEPKNEDPHRQPCSHCYSALSFQYRLPLLTSLIAFSQSLGYIFDESIKTLCIAKLGEPKSLQESGVLHCIFSALGSTFLSALSLVPHDKLRCEYHTVINTEKGHPDSNCFAKFNDINCVLNTYILPEINTC